MLRKKSVKVVTRSKATTTTSRPRLQDPILFTILDGISPESRGLIKELGLEKYGQNVPPKCARFIDVDATRKPSGYQKEQMSLDLSVE
ncbi:MAG: hypothetical protein ABSE80_07535 [Halobacteriota archaeon]